MNIFFAEQLRSGVQSMVASDGYTASVAHASGDTYTVTIEKDGQVHSRVFDPAVDRALGAWVRQWLHELELSG